MKALSQIQFRSLAMVLVAAVASHSQVTLAANYRLNKSRKLEALTVQGTQGVVAGSMVGSTANNIAATRTTTNFGTPVPPPMTSALRLPSTSSSSSSDYTLPLLIGASVLAAGVAYYFYKKSSENSSIDSGRSSAPASSGYSGAADNIGSAAAINFDEPIEGPKVEGAPSAPPTVAGVSTIPEKSGDDAGPTISPINRVKYDIFKLTNAYRLKNGKAKLSVNGSCEKAALKYAKEIAEKGKPETPHIGHDGSTFITRFAKESSKTPTSLGENYSIGYSTGAESLKNWIASPKHNKNLLEDFNQMGLGVAEIKFEGSSTKPRFVIVQCFVKSTEALGVATAPANAGVQ